MPNEVFFEVVDAFDVAGDSRLDTDFLRAIAAQYDLCNIAYLGVNIPSLTDKKTFGITTYRNAWVERYQAQDYIRIDPVVGHAMTNILPLDWQSVRDKNKRVQAFFSEATDFGVGSQGLSFPIRGAHGESALLSINSNCSATQWDAMKRRFMRDFQILAYHIHIRILEEHGVVFEDAKLTKREIDCLRWAAGGKTSWETGVILGITNKTAEFYIEQARVKLNATNKVQSVVKAVRLGYI
jgi:DNA-binding CsgD family transcriptional regulator